VTVLALRHRDRGGTAAVLATELALLLRFTVA
jgi:hypothetical protein